MLGKRHPVTGRGGWESSVVRDNGRVIFVIITDGIGDVVIAPVLI